MNNNLDIDRFIKILNLKYNLKIAAKELGFEAKNDVLFVKSDVYDLNIKFDDEEIIIWCSEYPRKKFKKYYNLVRTEVDKGFYTEKDFIENTLNLLSMGGK